MFALSTFGPVCVGLPRALGAVVVCRPSTRPVLIAPLLALALLLAAPAAAHADCPPQPLAHTFLPWLDPAWYEAAPDGGLEAGGAGWTLAGGAAVVAANDPYQPGASALALPAGATATTPPMCVDVAHPTLRFFTQGGSGPLTVSVLFRDSLGVEQELQVGTALTSPDWAPSAVMPVLGNVLSEQVSFRFASAGDWRVDDVFVDPYSKG
jgi:hypothetical protein